MDRLVDVHQKMKLVFETLYLTVNILACYLAKIFGATALRIVAKNDKIYPTKLQDLVNHCKPAP